MSATISANVRRVAPFVALLVAAAFAISLVPGAAALELNSPSDSAAIAYPDGESAQIPIELTWACTDFVGASDDIELTVNVTDGDGTATIEPSTVTPTSVSADCGPTESTNASATLTVTATGGAAGSTIAITVTANGPEAATQDAGANDDTLDLGVSIGPVVNVVIQPENSTDLVLYPGESSDENITVVSNSNDDVMVMQVVEETSFPEGWSAPSLGSLTLAAGGSNGTITVPISVPGDAEPGTYEVVIGLFAHSLADTEIMTDPMPILYTITVPEGQAPADGGDDTEESPAPAVPLLVTLGIVGIVALRRRLD